MNRLYTRGEMALGAILGIALGIVLTLLGSAGNSTTTVNVPRGAINLHLGFPPAPVQQAAPMVVIPQPQSGPVDPYGIQQYGYPTDPSLNACDLITTVDTMDGQFVPVTPESDSPNDDVSCSLRDRDYDYTVEVRVQPNATNSDYYDMLSANQSPDSLVSGMTQGPITYPQFGVAAPNINLAYQYDGTFSDGGSYQTVVFTATGVSGENYLVNLTVIQTYDYLPQPDALQLATDAALSLP